MFAKVAFLAVIAFAAVSAQAAEDLYPCNLELKRPQTQATDAGGFYARVYVEDLTAQAGPARFHWATLTAPKSGVWVKLLANADEFHYHIHDIYFPQSIPNLGTSYRVTFCYRGPVKNKARGDGSDSSQGRYDFLGSLSTGQTNEGIPYSGSVLGICDLRDAGNSKAAREETELYPAAVESDAQFSINLGRLPAGEIAFDTTINGSVGQVPRFCRILMQVNEDSNSERPNEVSLNPAQFMLQIDKDLR